LTKIKNEVSSVLVSIPKHNGQISAVEYHRLFIPFKKIENVIFTDNIEAYEPSDLIKNNVTQVWFNRNISPLTLNPDPIYKKLKSMGIKIVVDIDDYWKVGFGHVLYDVMIKMNLKNSNVSQIKYADYVVTTHGKLADIIKTEIKVPSHKILIAPNAIDPQERQYSKEYDYALENIFWQGSVTHQFDLKVAASAINELDKRIFIAGYVKESYYTKTDKSKLSAEPSGHLFDDRPWIYTLPVSERWKYYEDKGERIYHWAEIGKMFNKKQFIPELPVERYMEFYENKGITIIPLESSKFTSCKSNLKMLEAGWAKKPVVVSGVHPYTPLAKHGVNCLIARDRQSWKDNIKMLLDNPELAEDLRMKLNEDVKDNYLIEKVNQTRIQLINKINK